MKNYPVHNGASRKHVFGPQSTYDEQHGFTYSREIINKLWANPNHNTCILVCTEQEGNKDIIIHTAPCQIFLIHAHFTTSATNPTILTQEQYHHKNPTSNRCRGKVHIFSDTHILFFLFIHFLFCCNLAAKKNKNNDAF